MAKDVDLSSKEWRDIVFDGKNKEFGAYQMRGDSTRRHTKAVIIVALGLVVILALLILSLTGVFSRAEDEGPDAAIAQEMATFEADELPEEEPEEKFEVPQQQEEIIQPEEVANEQRVTELLIVEEVDKEKEVKNTSEVMENEAQAGAMDITEGTNDLNKQVVREQIIAPEPAPVSDEPVNIAMVEQKPQFPGGEQAMYKWLSDNLRYPQAAAEDGISGRVIVQFTISKTGTIEDVQVVRGPHQALNREAMRLVSSMPRWQPGRNNGQPVKVIYTLPVTFKLAD